MLQHGHHDQGKKAGAHQDRHNRRQGHFAQGAFFLGLSDQAHDDQSMTGSVRLDEIQHNPVLVQHIMKDAQDHPAVLPDESAQREQGRTESFQGRAFSRGLQGKLPKKLIVSILQNRAGKLILALER